MQIVAPSQPTLVQILQQMEGPPEPDESLEATPGGVEYDDPPRRPQHSTNGTNDLLFARSELESQHANGHRRRVHPDDEELRNP